MRIKDLITGLAHIGIPTRDLDATILFYNELGFDIVHLTKDPTTGGRVAFLQLGDIQVEAYEGQGSTLVTGALDHVAIAVSDIEKAYQTICDRCLNTLEDEIHFLPYWENGVRYFTIEGPNKEKVEFIQKL